MIDQASQQAHQHHDTDLSYAQYVQQNSVEGMWQQRMSQSSSTHNKSVLSSTLDVLENALLGLVPGGSKNAVEDITGALTVSQALDIATDTIPRVPLVKGGYELLTGNNPITGEPASVTEALIEMGSGLLPVVGPALKTVGFFATVGKVVERGLVGEIGKVAGAGLAGTESAALDSRTIAAGHVKEARDLLKKAGLTPAERNEILYSFDLETFRVEHVLESCKEYRLFDDGTAKLRGRYVSPNFVENQTNRIMRFALPKNSATRLGIVEIPKGAIVFTGRVAPQIDLSPGLIGGEMQTFLLGPLDQYSFEETIIPKNIISTRYSYGSH